MLQRRLLTMDVHAILRRVRAGESNHAIARAMHVVMIALLAWLALSFHLPWPAWAGIAVVAVLLAYEHSLVSPTDLSRMNAAFFTVNGYISLLFLLFWGAAVAVARR